MCVCVCLFVYFCFSCFAKLMYFGFQWNALQVSNGFDLIISRRQRSLFVTVKLFDMGHLNL